MFVTSLIAWKLLDLAMGLRVSAEAERLGQDTAELGIETYPEFVLMPVGAQNVVVGVDQA